MQIRDQVREHIAENHDFDSDGLRIGDDESLTETDTVDSLGMQNLAFFIESTFGFNVSGEEVIPENFDTINNLVTFISKKLNSD